jgi:hypothetical protein
MRKIFAIIGALIHREASINSVNKILISRTPGNVTEELAHN